MALDPKYVETLKRLSGIAPDAPEAEVRAMLAKAGVREDDVQAFFTGKPVENKIPDYMKPLDGKAYAPPPSPKVEKWLKARKIVVAIGLSIFGIYAILLPLLFILIYLYASILGPFSGPVYAFAGILYLLGPGMLGSMVLEGGLRAYAYARTDIIPSEAASISCGDGYSISVAADKDYRIGRAAGLPFDAPVLLSDENAGTLTLEKSGTSHSYPVPGDELQAPLVYGDYLHLFAGTLAAEQYNAKLASIIEGKEEGRLIRIPSEDFTVEDFERFGTCLDQSGMKELSKKTSLLSGVAGMYLDRATVHTDWTQSSAQFACPSGLSVRIQPPMHLAVYFEPVAQWYQIGTVAGDGSTRALLAAEREYVNPDTYFTRRLAEYEAGGANAATIRQELALAGLSAGVPKGFDSCRNPEGESVRQFIGL